MSSTIGLLAANQRSIHSLPVTTLHFLNDNTILSGEGYMLCVNSYTIGTAKECRRTATFQIFDHQAIHGILSLGSITEGSTSIHTIAIYGGRCVRLVRLRSSDVNTGWHVQLGQTYATEDWILGASIRSPRSLEQPAIALITAHDALWLFTPLISDLPQSTERDLVCIAPGSNTILYSAHVQWLDGTKILVASGTAFGDVILWSCELCSTRTQALPKTIHYSFSAHEGSIFGIRISDPSHCRSGETYARLLATSSDDRTVRAWDISNLPSRDVVSYEHDRGTGFGTSSNHPEGDLRPSLVSRVMGHLSRIWHVRFHRSSEHGLLVRSFGEDATMQTWSFDSQDALKGTPASMSLVSATQLHTGKNIWSVAESSAEILATGGADGAITVVAAFMGPPKHQLISVEPNDATVKDLPKSYTFLDDHHLFVVSRLGKACVFNLGGTRINMLHQVHELELANYSIVTAAAGLGFACGASGGIFGYSTGTQSFNKIATCSDKTTGLFACAAPQKPADAVDAREGLVALLRMSVRGAAQLLVLDQTGSSCQVRHDITVELPPDRIITSFVCTTMTSDSLVAIVGTRSGHLGLIFLLHEHMLEGKGTVSNITRVHTDAVTQVLWHAHSVDACQGHLVTASRDGSQAIHRINIGANIKKCSTARLHQLHLPFGPNIEGLTIMDGEELLVWGFRNKFFVVYSVTRQREIMTVDCGGVHRTWSFHPYLNGGRFVWTKASQVFTVEQKELPYLTLNAGCHGREIKALASTRSSDSQTIIATGAEDTCIRLFRHNHSANANVEARRETDLSCLQVLRKHNTGPQQLAFTACGRYLFSSGGFEEFFIWKLEHDVPLVELGVHCESEHPRSGRSDLRITSFLVDEEAHNGDAWRVYMTYSDSRVALWLYSRPGDWQHIIDADYLTACPTGMYSFLNGRVGRRFITTASDGHLALWKNDTRSVSSQQLTWQSRHKAHQSAILSGTSLNLADGSMVLVTGGDDNGITFTRLSAEFSEMNSMTVPSAHAAAVTALLVTSARQEAQRVHSTVLSVGLDQRLIVWRLSIDTSQTGLAGAQLQKHRVINVGVADATGIELLSQAKRQDSSEQTADIIVTGIGIQILTLCGL